MGEAKTKRKAREAQKVQEADKTQYPPEGQEDQVAQEEGKATLAAQKADAVRIVIKIRKVRKAAKRGRRPPPCTDLEPAAEEATLLEDSLSTEVEKDPLHISSDNMPNHIGEDLDVEELKEDQMEASDVTIDVEEASNQKSGKIKLLPMS